MPTNHWLTWAQQLQAIAQNGLAYAESPYDVERYAAIRQIAAELLAAHHAGADTGEASADALNTLLARQHGYATPKLDIRGACFDAADRILLVRERSDGAWTLPGGWVDIGDAPSVAIAREIREESGYVAHAVKLMAVWDKLLHDHPPDFFHIYKLIFLCEITDGRATHSVETDGVDFFAQDKLPPLSLERITAPQIARIFTLRNTPHAPTDFD